MDLSEALRGIVGRMEQESNLSGELLEASSKGRCNVKFRVPSRSSRPADSIWNGWPFSLEQFSLGF